ncbi:uncharacterized protein [Typha latifolia]|uniref:uncharacterized protein isoform X3 n=1 Tax=Typha latifolia TaxID=4733 RepID=UPI003C2EDC5A
MANGESQKQLLSLIREFASEKSHGERRVSDLKKRILEIQCDLDAANADLDRAKMSKETAEQEFRGSQVQLVMTDASIQVLQARVAHLQVEISKIRSDLAKLKNEEDTERDIFISKMADMNVKIRKFWEICFQEFMKQESHELLHDKGEEVSSEENNIKALEDKIKSIDAQIHKLDSDYHRELHDHDKNWKKYMLHLGRSCARSTDVPAVDLITWENLKRRKTNGNNTTPALSWLRAGQIPPTYING